MDNLPFDQSSFVFRQADELPEDLRAIARLYAAQPVPRPAQSSTTQLTRLLLAEAAFSSQETCQVQRPMFWQIFALARWRLLLLDRWFWIAGVLFLLGSLWIATQMGRAGATSFASLLILLLPLTAVLGLTHALRTPSAGLRAIEASCPVNFMQTTIGLALIILSFDTLLGAVATLAIALARWAPFWNLMLAWLSPLLFLTAISLPVALRWGALKAALVGGLPWVLLGVVGFISRIEQNGPNFATLLFSLPQDTLSLSYHLATIVLSIVLLWALFTTAPKWQRLWAL